MRAASRQRLSACPRRGMAVHRLGACPRRGVAVHRVGGSVLGAAVVAVVVGHGGARWGCREEEGAGGPGQPHAGARHACSPCEAQWGLCRRARLLNAPPPPPPHTRTPLPRRLILQSDTAAVADPGTVARITTISAVMSELVHKAAMINPLHVKRLLCTNMETNAQAPVPTVSRAPAQRWWAAWGPGRVCCGRGSCRGSRAGGGFGGGGQWQHTYGGCGVLCLTFCR